MKKDKKGNKWYSEKDVELITKGAFRNGWNRAASMILEAMPKLITEQYKN